MQQQQQMQAEQKQREEEMARQRRQQDEQRRIESNAQMNAKKVMQKLRTATPEDVEEVKQEVETTLMQELPKCGQQAEAIRMEATQMIQEAFVRVEKIKEQRIEEERINKERTEEAKRLLGELGGLVEKAEKDTATLKEAAAPVMEAKVLGVEAAKAAGKAVSEASVDAKVSCKACTDFIVEKRATIESAKPFTEVREDLLKLQSRIQECYKLVVSASISAKILIDKAIKKTVADEKFAKRASLFGQYSNKDGTLSASEITAYAKGEFKFALKSEIAAKIVAQLSGGKKGVPKELFQRVKVAVGIAREEETSRIRRKEAEELRLALEAKRKALEADVAKVAEALAAVEPAFAKAEETAKPEQLSKAYLSAAEPAPDRAAVEAVMEAASSALNTARSELSAVRAQATALGSEVDEGLKNFIQLEVRKLDLKVMAFDARLVPVGSALERGRLFLEQQDAVEVRQLQVEVGKQLRSKKLTPEELFTAADKDADGVVNLAEFKALLEGSGISDDRLGKFFKHTDAGGLNKVSLQLLSKSYYSVSSNTVITKEAVSEEEGTIRRLDLKEVLEVLEGPVEADAAGVVRARCRCLRDGTEGWVAVAGNAGTVYLVPTEATLEVLKDLLAMTTDFEPEGEEVSQLKLGERLEVLEWDKKSETGVVRVRAKVKGGAAVGWVTRAGPDGFPFLR